MTNISHARLFAIAIVYFITRWLLSWKNSKLIGAIGDREGQLEGSLVHKFIGIEKTLSGKTTDVTFHYVQSLNTDCECVVFLHGFMDTWKLWHHSLEFLADRYHVIAFDLKGCGQSSMNYPQRLFPEINDPGGNYSIALQAEEIMTAITALGIEKFNLVTLDLGTIIGDLLAGQFSDAIIRYIRCQQPLVGHFRSSIPQGQFLRRKRGAKLLTTLLESDASSLVRILYGKTGWPALDRQMKRTKYQMCDRLLDSAVQEASHPFKTGPKQGKPGTFTCAWAGLYQHNQDYQQFISNNIEAYKKYTFPVILLQGIHDIAMPRDRFDGTTGMAFKFVRNAGREKILSRPFYAGGRGLGDGYEPWGDFIPNCTKPLPVEAFFPKSPFIQLKFMDAGHFIPIEAPEEFTAVLNEVLSQPLTTCN
jgi:pimeloyl-ACP methyl ester carboxylesterase